MTWTAPEATRTIGPLTGGERETLTAFLAFYRSTLLQKCSGLTGRQLAEQTVEPSNLTLLGLVRHMAKVERIWFREGLTGLALPSMYDTQKGKDADFEDLSPDRAPDDYARLVEEMRLADEAAADASLDTTFTRRGSVYSLRTVYVHMIAEYARHIGHADLLRERLDGATGA
ncbi:DinB family protein [Streptomyces sp. QL37]|uniref:DinB family protein n=1 Tax=Streptomyces sp. QL37 TaxID=2093747 RepID=UPI000CF1DC70|nr:DinB family protein [Streptomyces sp. QL37]PPQ61816.1 Mini-circle protein [Streptomyces sp. QL37]